VVKNFRTSAKNSGHGGSKYSLQVVVSGHFRKTF